MHAGLGVEGERAAVGAGTRAAPHVSRAHGGEQCLDGWRRALRGAEDPGGPGWSEGREGAELSAQRRRGLGSPLAAAGGRLMDGAGALAGVRGWAAGRADVDTPPLPPSFWPEVELAAFFFFFCTPFSGKEGAGEGMPLLQAG